MKLFATLLAAIAVFAAPAHATPVTFDFIGPHFQLASGAFTTADKITGSVTFDSSLFSKTGALSLSSTDGAIGAFQWAFQDGHNAFSNVLTTSRFTIAMDFANYLPSSWNIDTTWGVTPNADIFVRNQGGSTSYESYYRGAYAGNVTPLSNTSSNWAMASAVPEPASVALIGLGLLGIAAARRRQQ